MVLLLELAPTLAIFVEMVVACVLEMGADRVLRLHRIHRRDAALRHAEHVGIDERARRIAGVSARNVRVDVVTRLLAEPAAGIFRPRALDVIERLLREQARLLLVDAHLVKLLPLDALRGDLRAIDPDILLVDLLLGGEIFLVDLRVVVTARLLRLHRALFRLPLLGLRLIVAFGRHGTALLSGAAGSPRPNNARD